MATALSPVYLQTMILADVYLTCSESALAARIDVAVTVREAELAKLILND